MLAIHQLLSISRAKTGAKSSKAYGAISSPPAAELLQASLTSITMSVDENVYTFMDRLQSLLANIHITLLAIEEIPLAIEEIPLAERLSFAQVYQSCLYTTAKRNIAHPNNPAFTNHLTVLLRLLSAITDTRLHKVVYDFNTKYTIPAERTVERLEAALPLNEQFSHQVSNAATSNKTNGTSVVQKFCTFHSFGGNASTHSTADCKTINKSLTKNDPTSSQ